MVDEVFEPLAVDWERWGEWRAAGGVDVIPVASLVHLYCYVHREPIKPAVRAVLDRIAAMPGVRAYVTRRNDHALPVTTSTGWPGVTERGLPGLLKLARLRWADKLHGRFDQFSAAIHSGQFAVHHVDARAIFSDEFDVAFSSDDGDRPAVVQAAQESGPLPEALESGPSSADRRIDAVTELRRLEGSETKGARAKVAATYGVSPRTVGKWVDWVETSEAKQRSDLAQGRQYTALQRA